MDLAQVIRDTIEGRLGTVNTAIPALVTRVDVAKGMVDAQPLLKKKYATGEVVEIPIISNVPIANYRAGNAFISLPVKVGHTVLLIFSQRSIDRWAASGGSVDPADPRMFNLNDAIAYPGIYPFSSPPTGADPDDIIIKNEKGVIRVKPAGKFQVTNGENELVDLVKQLAQKLSDTLDTLRLDTTNTIFGPMQLNNFSTYATLEADVEEIKGKVETLRG